jgi:VanZ family protein
VNLSPSRQRPSPSVLTAAHYGWLALGMLLLAVYGSLIPFHYRPRPLAEALSAFRHIAYYDPSDLGARGDWAVSVALFLALSYLLMAALCVDRRRRVGLCAAPAVVLACAVLSVAIEFVQLYFPPRTVSLNDIAVETLGGVAGTLLWLTGGQRITRWVRRVGTATGLTGLAGRLFPGYLALLLVVLLMPFDLTVSTGELAAKFQEGKIWLLPFHYRPPEGRTALLAKTALNMACFFPVGFLRVLASERSGAGRRRWPWVLLFGLGITSLVEFLQLFVYSRFCDTTDIVTGTAAVWLGWRSGEWFLAAWRSALTRSGSGAFAAGPDRKGRPAVWATLFLAWFGGVIYLNWQPFNFTTDPAQFTEGPEEVAVWGIRRMAWLPLVDYYWGSKYQALDQFLKKSLAFLPLGLLCALASNRVYRPRAALAVAAVALLAALVIEAGRYFLPSRTASVTDVLIQGFGAWLGFKLTQHLRALLWAECALYGYLHKSPSGQAFPAGRL